MKIDESISAKDILNWAEIDRDKSTPYITTQISPDRIFEDP